MLYIYVYMIYQSTNQPHYIGNIYIYIYKIGFYKLKIYKSITKIIYNLKFLSEKKYEYFS